MPYQWLPPEQHENHLHAWPHRSLTPDGFAAFFAATGVLVALPALTLLGSPALWGLLPFAVLAVGGMWWAIRRNQRDGDILEDLTLTPVSLRLTRHGPRGRRQDWQANPHWVQITLHATGGPVPNYLTLRGNGREVELGAFLSEEERIALRAELQDRLRALR
jgi:uncharacterized membrane protein